MHTTQYNINDLILNPVFHLVIDQLNDGVLITDAEGYIRYVNPAYARIVNIVINDVIDRKVQDVRKGSRLPEVLQSGEPLLGIKRTVDQVDYIVDITPILIKGKVAGAISLVRDITQIEKLSKTLRVYSHRVTELSNKVNEIHRPSYSFDDIIGSSKEMDKVKTMAKRVANSTVSILILGESGTGKECFAHALHKASSRSTSPFVAINCAALPPALLISEIFGYEEGSFTGASKGGKLGLFEIANGGTLFLDEIGDMDFELQSKLLRVIETGEFLRVGGTKPTKVDVRIISATNKDLERMIGENRFREDLYYRLNAASIKLPPLRERLSDIPLLVDYFLKKIQLRLQRNCTMSEAGLQILCQYHFPGNVRQLINILEFAASTCEGDTILPEDLPNLTKTRPLTITRTLSNTARDSERDAIVAALKSYGTSVTAKHLAAKHLGISLSTLYNKIKQYQIKL